MAQPNLKNPPKRKLPFHVPNSRSRKPGRGTNLGTMALPEQRHPALSPSPFGRRPAPPQVSDEDQC